MVGVVIITHQDVGRQLLEAAEVIVGKLSHFEAVSVTVNCVPADVGQRLQKAIDSVDKGDGVLVLTDLFGGTPSNLSLSFLKSGTVEVLTGVNLPMVLTLATSHEGKSLAEVAEKTMSSGRENIRRASTLLVSHGESSKAKAS